MVVRSFFFQSPFYVGKCVMSAELHVPKKFRRFLHGIHYRKRLLDAAEIHVLRRKWLFESVMLLQELVI